jgi:hypothetical protein
VRNPDDSELVRRAILSSTTGDCRWKESLAERIRSDRYMMGLTPEAITAHLREYVRHGGQIDRRVDREPEEHSQDYWYRVIVPVEEFTNGLFVKIVLVDDDVEMPAVRIVSVHEQRI